MEEDIIEMISNAEKIKDDDFSEYEWELEKSNIYILVED